MAQDATNRSTRRDISASRRLTRLILLIAGLVFLMSGLYNASVYGLSRAAGFDEVKAVSLERSVSGSAWSFQREYAIQTDKDCMVIPMVGEGERVYKGLEVARLNFSGDTKLTENSNRRLYSQIAGIVSFEPDGLEIIREAQDYRELTIKALEDQISGAESERRTNASLADIIQDKVRQESEEGAAEQEKAVPVVGIRTAPAAPAEPKSVPAGAAVMKITDNLSDCYIYLRLPEQNEPPFSIAQTITMKMDGAGTGRATALSCEAVSGGWGLLLKLESGLEILRHSRKHTLELVLGTEECAAVSSGTVAMKDGVLGIYVAQGNRVQWKPVTIIEERNGMLIIEGEAPEDIRPGVPVATRPWLIWDGMRLQGRV